MGRADHVQGFQALVAADAMVHVHHQIAVAQGADLGEIIRRPATSGGGPGQALAQNVLLAEQGQVADAEALL